MGRWTSGKARVSRSLRRPRAEAGRTAKTPLTSTGGNTGLQGAGIQSRLCLLRFVDGADLLHGRALDLEPMGSLQSWPPFALRARHDSNTIFTSLRGSLLIHMFSQVCCYESLTRMAGSGAWGWVGAGPSREGLVGEKPSRPDSTHKRQCAGRMRTTHNE